MAHIDELRELRADLYERMKGADDRNFAALARQYRETIREIDEIESGETGDDRAAQIVRRHHEAR